MAIDVQVPFALQRQVHHGVFREQRQHVVEERDARLNRRLSLAIDVQPGFDPRFFRDAADRRSPQFHPGAFNQTRLGGQRAIVGGPRHKISFSINFINPKLRLNLQISFRPFECEWGKCEEWERWETL
jgi:hypothetical protein